MRSYGMPLIAITGFYALMFLLAGCNSNESAGSLTRWEVVELSEEEALRNQYTDQEIIPFSENGLTGLVYTYNSDIGQRVLESCISVRLVSSQAMLLSRLGYVYRPEYSAYILAICDSVSENEHGDATEIEDHITMYTLSFSHISDSTLSASIEFYESDFTIAHASATEYSAVPRTNFTWIQQDSLSFWVRAVCVHEHRTTNFTVAEIENWDEYVECKMRKWAYDCGFGAFICIASGAAMPYCALAVCTTAYVKAAKECFDEWHVEPGGGLLPESRGRKLVVDNLAESRHD